MLLLCDYIAASFNWREESDCAFEFRRILAWVGGMRFLDVVVTKLLICSSHQVMANGPSIVITILFYLSNAICHLCITLPRNDNEVVVPQMIVSLVRVVAVHNEITKYENRVVHLNQLLSVNSWKFCFVLGVISEGNLSNSRAKSKS